MNKCRVRFAPSPTGIMHIGNVRTALLNYVFALKNHGTFVLRIEDTDQERNISPQSIFDHLAWLNIIYQEGPKVEGPYGPYFQSQRHDIYQNYLEKLQATGNVYRCFCTQEELEIKRNRQIALKNPPRYDRTCLKLSADLITKKIEEKNPFIWRMKINEHQTIQFKDLGHQEMLTFNPQHFSDFAISRVDGSFTFMFANCIDDITMNISHILRGQDHMTNTVGQIAIMKALGHTPPTFWHLPILFNTDNKKLSKRDQGFSLEDLQAQGFLPQAIVNYLGIIGASFEKEILSIEQLADAYNFENMHTTNQIKYDIEKMKWINHKWIAQTSIDKLMNMCKPFLAQKYNLNCITDETLQILIQSVQTDIIVLQDICTLLEFYFITPKIDQEKIDAVISYQTNQQIKIILEQHKHIADFNDFLDTVKKSITAHNIALKDFFAYVRLMITGQTKGLGIKELEKCLGFDEIQKRIYRSI